MSRPDVGHSSGMTNRRCPECGQVGIGPVCFHWDAAGMRKVPTVPLAPVNRAER